MSVSQTLSQGTAGKELEQETKEKLLIELQPFSHGEWAHMNINRVALFGRNLKEATSTHQYGRFHSALVEYLEKVHPLLASIAEQFQLLAFDPGTIRLLNHHADELAKIAQPLSLHPDLQAGEIKIYEAEIPLHVDQLLKVFRVMREHIFKEFRCKPREVLRRILERYSTLRTDVKFISEVQSLQTELMIVASETEFAYTVETLFHDILNRVQDNEGRVFSVSEKLANSRWELEVRDNKLYLEPHLWAQLFASATGIADETKLSTLPLILKKYDADICVKESIRDIGTTFLIRWKTVQP